MTEHMYVMYVIVRTLQRLFPKKIETGFDYIPSSTTTMATTTIINKATYNADYAEKRGGLMFPGEFWDCRRYVNTSKLRKTLNLKGRGRILHILTRNSDDPLFVNVANKEIEYKTPVGVERTMDGAYMGTYSYVTRHPIGNVVIVLAE